MFRHKGKQGGVARDVFSSSFCLELCGLWPLVSVTLVASQVFSLCCKLPTYPPML